MRNIESSAEKTMELNPHPLGFFLVEKFDSIVKTPDFAIKQMQIKIYTKFLLETLVQKYDMDRDELASIEINIIHRKTDEEEAILPQDPFVQEARDNLTKEFGNEVVRRLLMSVADEEEI